jgi:hypothetical protein
MSETTTTPEPDEVTAGWLFMTANALGLSDADLAFLLGVRPDTIRKSWKYGTAPIADGVRTDLQRFVAYTDEAVEVLVSRAENTTDPAIIVYPNLRDVPEGHLAGEYGITWWDHVAFSVHKRVPDLYVGNLMEVATAYDVEPAKAASIHDDPAVLAIYVTPRRTRANRLA